MTPLADITLHPVLPLWLLALLGVGGALAALARIGAAGWLPTLVRLASLALLAGALTAPTRIAQTDANAPRPPLEILVDASASMGVCDILTETGPSRLDALRNAWLHPDSLATMRDRADVRLSAFAGDARTADPATLTPAGDASDIQNALNTALRSTPPGGRILLLTDGATTNDSPFDVTTALAQSRDIRIDTVPVGADEAFDNSAIALSVDRQRIRAGDRVSLTANLAGRAGRVTIAQITPDGATQTLYDDIPDGAAITIDATPPAPAAERASVLYLATLTTDAPDADPRNNESLVAVEVTRAPLSVLVLEGEPSWQTRFLLDVLRADPRFDTTAALALGPRSILRRYTSDASDASPGDPFDLLQTADIVILGRGVERWIDAQRASALADRLARSGGVLVFLRGDPLTDAPADVRQALDQLAPVAWGAQTLSDTSLRSTGIAPLPIQRAIARVPGAMSTLISEGERSLARVWLRAQSPSMPTEPAAVATMRLGAGVSLAVLTDELWRWATTPDPAAPRAFATFWQGALRALAGESLDAMADVRIDLEDLNPRVGDVTALRISGARADEITLRIDSADDSPHILTPPATSDAIAGWEASLTPQRAGLHRIAAIDASGRTLAEALLMAREPAIEMATTRARPDLLESIAVTTRGQSYPLDGAGAYLADLALDRAVAAGETSSIPLWPRPWLFALIAGLLLTEWTLRRLRGAP